MADYVLTTYTHFIGDQPQIRLAILSYERLCWIIPIELDTSILDSRSRTFNILAFSEEPVFSIGLRSGCSLTPSCSYRMDTAGFTAQVYIQSCLIWFFYSYLGC